MNTLKKEQQEIAELAQIAQRVAPEVARLVPWSHISVDDLPRGTNGRLISRDLGGPIEIQIASQVADDPIKTLAVVLHEVTHIHAGDRHTAEFAGICWGLQRRTGITRTPADPGHLYDYDLSDDAMPDARQRAERIAHQVVEAPADQLQDVVTGIGAERRRESSRRDGRRQLLIFAAMTSAFWLGNILINFFK